MLGLRIVFLIFFLISLICAVLGFLGRRKNIGFIITALVIAANDVLMFLLLNAENADGAASILIPFYILHPWGLVFYMLMVSKMDKTKPSRLALIPMCLLSAYQTYMMVCQYMGQRIMQFQKRIYFRKGFWVAVLDSKNPGFLFGFNAYRILVYTELVIIVAVLIYGCRKSNRIFRSRYYALIFIAIVTGAAEFFMYYFSIPQWIPCMIYNGANIVFLYYAESFSRARLKEWSLDSFANDMSDGLILYDKYKDLIHINDMIKSTLGESLAETFKDRKKLETWIRINTDKDMDDIVRFKADGKEYFFRVTVRDMGEGNSNVGTLFILHDNTNAITRIKAMEKANEELERASRMKSDFLANMSHEIRTPMNAVIGMAEIAMHEEDRDKQMENLMQIQNSGKNLLNIINDILDYSKIESGKMEIIEEDYVPFDEFTEISNVLATRLGDKNLEFYLLVDGSLPHKVHADAMRIRQVLINLANNAIKFTNEGSVIIKVKCEPLSSDQVTMSFHIIDTGIGIRKDDMDKLFVSFQQLDSRRNRSVEGTGLGLAISQKLVEAMNGKIGVESTFGKGSDFWFSVPVRVVDATNDLEVKDAAGKFAVGINEKPILVEQFNDEMANLGVENVIRTSLKDYSPSGRKEYFFIEENYYTYNVKEFFASHPDITCIVLVPMKSEFKPDKPNVHVMRRPATTMKMVNLLNDRFEEVSKPDEKKVFTADFTAPDAKVLVVDDNNINLSIAEGLMTPLKLQVDKADGGQKAIDMVAAKDYDIVFMDHMMPEIDGVDATKTIRANSKDPLKPVIIALSANAMEEARKLFKEAGMNDFVAKPIDVRILTTKIKEWLPADKIKSKTAEDQAAEAKEENAVFTCEDLDTETAIRALGSAVLYEKIAKEYYLSGNDKLSEIKKSYDSKDWEGYTIKVHALKSSSRQIGAMALGNMAEALEKAGKAGDTDKILADTDALLETYEDLLSKMAPHYGETKEEAADKPEFDKATLEGLLDEMAAACDDLDYDAAEEAVNRINSYAYEGDLKGLVADLDKAINGMDFESCLEVIDKIRGIL